MKQNVFNRDLKTVKVFEFQPEECFQFQRISTGRVFQVEGPAVLKACLPYVAVYVLGTSKSPRSADL